MEGKPFTVGCLVSDGLMIEGNSGNSLICPVGVLLFK